jgi:hypothetical protein
MSKDEIKVLVRYRTTKEYEKIMKRNVVDPYARIPKTRDVIMLITVHIEKADVLFDPESRFEKRFSKYILVT